MKIISILTGWILIFAPVLLNAQVSVEQQKTSVLQIGIYYEPDFANRFYYKDDVRPASVIRNSAKLSHTAGITGCFKVSNRIALRTGIGFTDKGYAFDTQVNYGPYRVTLSYYYLFGSLGIKYYITKPGYNKYQFFGSVSYFTNGYISNRQSVKYLEDKSKYIVYNREARFRSIAHSGSISFGLEHPINNRLISVFEPTFNFPLTPFKSDDTYYPYSFGVRLEIKYALF